MKKISFLLTGLALILFLGCENPAASTEVDEEVIENATETETEKEVSAIKVGPTRE